MDTLHGRIILIVEDLVTDARLVERSLKRAGIESRLTFVSDGQQAIEYLDGEGAYADREAHPLPVVILLDLKLPKRDGFEVLAWIRAHDAVRDIPVVVLTSSNRSPDIDRATALGASAYLVKPAEGDVLLDVFHKLGVA